MKSLHAVLLGAGLSGAPEAQAPVFVDESVKRGVLFKHVEGSATGSMGGGVAFFDYDGDGDDDLFVVSSDGQHKLFEHTGAGFTDRTAGSGLPMQFPDSMGVIAADYNQDGRIDLYVTAFGPNQLYTNLGNGRFRDDAQALGVAGNDFSVSAAFADFDRDGDLDLYVGDYVKIQNFPYSQGTPNKLYLNVGSRTVPKYLEVARFFGVEDSGVFPPPRKGFPYPNIYPALQPGKPTWGCTLSVSTIDFDGDGDQDILVGNDFGQFVLPNRLYRNDTPRGGLLKFTDVSVLTGFANDGHYNMGISAADFDHDGDWDFYLSNLGDNVFHENRNGSFVDVAAAAGPVEGRNDRQDMLLSSWGTVFADFDNDRWEDLLVVNGFINGAIMNRNDPFSPNHLWMNLGTGKFRRVDPQASGMADTGPGRGVAASDVDGDGLLDFYVMNNGAAPGSKPGDRCRLFMNRTVTSNRSLQLRLHGSTSNLEGLGARVRAEIGGEVLRRQVLADPCYLSSSTRAVHFGFGGQPVAERVVIDWPSGIHQQLVGVPAGLRLQVLEPRVTMQTTSAPVYANGAVQWTVALSNRSANFQIADVVWFLLLGKGGPLVATLQKNEFLAGYGTATATVRIPMPLAMWQSIQGTAIEQLTYVGASGAVDSRRQVDVLK